MFGTLGVAFHRGLVRGCFDGWQIAEQVDLGGCGVGLPRCGADVGLRGFTEQRAPIGGDDPVG